MNSPYYNPYQFQQPIQQQMPQMQNAQQVQTGFVTVPTEEEALRYPIAPGNSIIFKIEGKPVIIEKSMGFSQFESPKVEKYKLEKEEAPTENEAPKYALAEELESMKGRLNRMEGELKGFMNRKRRQDNE